LVLAAQVATAYTPADPDIHTSSTLPVPILALVLLSVSLPNLTVLYCWYQVEKPGCAQNSQIDDEVIFIFA
jgi:hypothetical protein